MQYGLTITIILERNNYSEVLTILCNKELIEELFYYKRYSIIPNSKHTLIVCLGVI